MVIEIDGSIHYYSVNEPFINLATDFKYRMCDLYHVPYMRLEHWKHEKEPTEKGVTLDEESIWRQITLNMERINS